MQDREIGRKQKTVGPHKHRGEFEKEGLFINFRCHKDVKKYKKHMKMFNGLGSTEDFGELMKAFLIEWWRYCLEILVQRYKYC